MNIIFAAQVFIRGMSGIMFRQMAYVVGFSLLCSLVVALTLVPMLASRFLHYRRADGGADQGRLQREGNAYLGKEFPRMDFVKKATIER